MKSELVILANFYVVGLKIRLGDFGLLARFFWKMI